MIITQSDRNFYNEHKDEYTHILSIVCPDEKDLVVPLNDNHLIIKMWDIDKPLKNKFRSYDIPDQEEVEKPLVWSLYKWHDSLINNTDFRLLVHCDAGISRSSAITLGILWELSGMIFREDLLFNKDYLKPYLEARKQWCKSLLDWNNSVALCRYIDGRFNPGVKPNEAILQIYRHIFCFFPW